MLEEKFQETRSVLSRALDSPEMTAVAARLPARIERTLEWAHAFTRTEQLPSEAAARLAEADRAAPGTFAAYRFLLIRHGLHSLPSLEKLPIADSVKTLTLDEYQLFCSTDPDWLHLVDPAAYSYRALTKISILKRFRAGLLDFEITGFPLRWLPKLPKPDVLRTLAFLAFRMGGLGPVWFPHNAFLRGKIQIMREREWDASLQRIVKSLAMQPEVKGILTGSWFYCAETHRVTPHLAWTTRIFLENRALITNLGPADPDAGFLQGSKERQALYDSGQYRPTETILLWPRRDALHWLQQRASKAPKPEPKPELVVNR